MLLYSIILFSFALPNYIFKGHVVDASDKPINNANIVLYENEVFGQSSDANGFFALDLKDKRYIKIKISHIGYADKIIDIDVEVDNNLKIALSESILDYDEIVVTGNKNQTYIKDSPVLTHVISSEDISNSVYTNVKDVLEMVLPNMQNQMWTHANFTSDKIKIQGLGDQYILFLIDGARVSGEFSGMIDFTMLNLSNVERIEIVEGGMSSLYGSSAIGGVVNIITKKNKQDFSSKLSYLYDDPLNDSKNLNLGFSINDFSYMLDLNKISSDGYDLTLNDAVYSGNGGIYTKTLESYDAFSHYHKLNYNFNSKYFLEMSFKNYIKDIFVYEDNETSIDIAPYFTYYTSPQYERPKSEDDRYSFQFNIHNMNSLVKISYNKEQYKKSSVYFNYTNIPNNPSIANFYNSSNNFELREFINAIHINEAFNIEYDKIYLNHHFTFGVEYNDDSYSSFNIYKNTGDYGPQDNYDETVSVCDNPNWNPSTGFQGCIFTDWDHDGDGSDGSDGGTPPQPGEYINQTINYDFEYGVCDYPLDSSITDCEYSSIFGGIDDSKYFNRTAFYFGDSWNLNNNDRISFAVRNVQAKNYKNNNVYSFAYMLKQYQPYDIRFNYSKGFRVPSIKELYYNFLGHDPVIVGNSDLIPTSNDYFSFSIDKRMYNSSYSVEFFYNDVKDMIGTIWNVEDGEMKYYNFNNVIITGFNSNYEKEINYKNKLKFVFNYTNPSSDDLSALELMSKYSFRMNYLYTVLENKLQFSLNVKYLGEKFVLDGDSKVWLDDYVMADFIFLYSPIDALEIKFGFKNILDYKDERRFGEFESSEYLSSYDPGRRVIAQITFKY
tara:strand:+ start:2747 stop:5248 length:2502 start_codon:yes stop_codon:yes gene_type:complete